MKSEKGVTLLSLVIYMIIFTMVLGILTVVSNYFYRNIYQVKETPKYISEFNKFSMFFVNDVKSNNDIKNITATTLEFKDGTKYKWENNKIYRDDKEIAKYIRNFTFTLSEYKVDATTKKIINVNTEIGTSKEKDYRNIDFVLKYW